MKSRLVSLACLVRTTSDWGSGTGGEHSRIERALADLQHLTRDALQMPRDGVAVGRAPGQGLEDEHLEGAGQQLGGEGRAIAHCLSMPRLLMPQHSTPAPTC